MVSINRITRVQRTNKKRKPHHRRNTNCKQWEPTSQTEGETWTRVQDWTNSWPYKNQEGNILPSAVVWLLSIWRYVRASIKHSDALLPSLLEKRKESERKIENCQSVWTGGRNKVVNNETRTTAWKQDDAHHGSTHQCNGKAMPKTNTVWGCSKFFGVAQARSIISDLTPISRQGAAKQLSATGWGWIWSSRVAQGKCQQIYHVSTISTPV